MKILSLDSYISEKKSISPLTIKQIKDLNINLYNYFPKNRKELKYIISERIKKEGNECNLNDINTSVITDIHALFSNMEDFNGNISEWDVSNVKNMYGMFYYAESFNGDISRWNVSNVKDMNFMFYSAESFDVDISKWNVSKVKDMSCIFLYAKSFDVDISKWNVSKVKDMNRMFNFCPLGKHPEKQPKFNK